MFIPPYKPWFRTNLDIVQGLQVLVDGPSRQLAISNGLNCSLSCSSNVSSRKYIGSVGTCHCHWINFNITPFVKLNSSKSRFNVFRIKARSKCWKVKVILNSKYFQIQGVPSILEHFRTKKYLVRFEVETKSRSVLETSRN